MQTFSATPRNRYYPDRLRTTLPAFDNPAAFEGYSSNGKQVRKTKTWKPPVGMSPKKAEKEAMKAAILFEQQVQQGLVLSSGIKFEDFAKRYFEEYANDHLRPRTLQGYKQLLPRINAAIGQIHIDKLRPNHLNAFYKQLSAEGVRADSKAQPIADIRSLAKASGLTQKALAASAGLHINTLREAYNNRPVSIESAQKISTALGKDFSFLFSYTKTNKGLSPSTVRKYHNVISSIMQRAVKWQLVYDNPAHRAELPKQAHEEAVYLNEYQAQDLLSLLKTETEEHRVMVSLLLFTGMRRAELCGLEWHDIDFDHALISIRRTSQYIAGQGIIEDCTKNTSSYRAIKISSSVISMLKAYRLHQTEARFKAGALWNPDRAEHPRLFTRPDGLPINPDSLTSWFRDFINRTDLPAIHIHSLRHTNATLQIASNIPVTTVADRLGHATPATTTKIYSHAIQSANAAAAEALENLLAPTANRTTTKRA